MVNSITMLLLGLVDQAMVGRISIFAYGAVGLVSNTIYAITGILGMLAVAFNILGSNSKGSDDFDDLKRKFNLTILISMGFGGVFFLVMFLFNETVLRMLFGLSGEILREAQNFVKIYSLIVGIDMVLFVFSAYFKIINETKWILLGSLAASLSNILFDYILIFGKFGFPQMGVSGAATASVLALILNLIICLVVGRKILDLAEGFKKFFLNIKELFELTWPLMGQEFLEGTLFVLLINAFVARIGVVEVSAFSLIFTIINIVLMPMYAYSTASLTLVSQNFESKAELNGIPRACLKMALTVYFVLAVIVIVARDFIPALITNEAVLISASATLIPIAMFIQLFNYTHSIYKSSLQGIREERWVLAVSVIINITCIMIIYCLTFVFKQSLIGVYTGIGLNYFLLTALLLSRYKRVLDNKF